MKIRFATLQDTDALLKIYKQYIDTSITFEYVLPSHEEFSNRISTIQKDGFPYIVAEDKGKIIGYAYAHPPFERVAYAWCCELSIYLAKDARAKGLGSRMYLLLMEILRLQGTKTVYGVVTGENKDSIEFHLNLGFSILGTFHKTGFKNHTWLDVVWFEKALAPYNDNPSPIIPVQSIPSQTITHLIEQSEKSFSLK